MISTGWKALGAAVAAASIGAAGVLASGRAAANYDSSQSTISAPALTTADIAALRSEIAAFRKDTGERLDVLSGRVYKVEGYLQGQHEARR